MFVLVKDVGMESGGKLVMVVIQFRSWRLARGDKKESKSVDEGGGRERNQKWSSQ